MLVTYDPNGFYGHPDHIQAHRVAMRAAERAATQGLGPDKIYWTAMPRSVLESGLAAFAESSYNPFEGVERVDDVPFATPDDEIAARIDATKYADAKVAAMRAHATQIPPESWLYAIAGNFGEEFMGVEYYRLAAGVRGRGTGPHAWEEDLFAGLVVGDGAGARTGEPARGRRRVSGAPRRRGTADEAGKGGKRCGAGECRWAGGGRGGGGRGDIAADFLGRGGRLAGPPI